MYVCQEMKSEAITTSSDENRLVYQMTCLSPKPICFQTRIFFPWKYLIILSPAGDRSLFPKGFQQRYCQRLRILDNPVFPFQSDDGVITSKQHVFRAWITRVSSMGKCPKRNSSRQTDKVSISRVECLEKYRQHV